MGITELCCRMPRVYGAYRSLIASIRQRRPDVAILIDFPDVNFRLARELKKLGIPVIYFVSPQLWAWKRRRLRWVQQRVTRMMVIFPFEARFYRARSVDAQFVGHPLAELPRPTLSRKPYAAAHGLDPAREWIALLPGSRWKEITANLEIMIEMAHRFPLGYDYILPVASTIDRKELADFIAGHDPWWPGDADSAMKACHIRLVPELLQTRFTAENVAAALQPLLADTRERDRMIANLAEVRRTLQPPPGTTSIQQVSDAVEALLAGKPQPSGPNSTASV